MSTPRDTQFAGFATLLLEQLQSVEGVYIESNYGEVHELWKPIIAARAYDLLLHAAYATSFVATMDVCRERVATVPDLTEWPKESSSE